MAKGMNVIVAAAVGAIAGLLLAPKSGKETRDDLKTRAQDAQKMATDKSEKMRGAVKDTVSNLRSGAKDINTEVQGLTDHAKKSAGRIGNTAKKTDEEVMIDVDTRIK